MREMSPTPENGFIGSSRARHERSGSDGYNSQGESHAALSTPVSARRTRVIANGLAHYRHYSSGSENEDFFELVISLSRSLSPPMDVLCLDVWNRALVGFTVVDGDTTGTANRCTRSPSTTSSIRVWTRRLSTCATPRATGAFPCNVGL
jgi:hypothetical protein